jgi:hypothetical protein
MQLSPVRVQARVTAKGRVQVQALVPVPVPVQGSARRRQPRFGRSHSRHMH